MEDIEDEEVVTREIAPVATQDIPQILGVIAEDDPERPKQIPVPIDKGIQEDLLTPLDRGRVKAKAQSRRSKSPGKETFVTANEEPLMMCRRLCLLLTRHP